MTIIGAVNGASNQSDITTQKATPNRVDTDIIRVNINNGVKMAAAANITNGFKTNPTPIQVAIPLPP